MRSGRLKTIASLVSESGKPLKSGLLIGITDQDDDIPLASGLLSNARISIRCRWQPSGIVRAGCWLIADGRQFLITGISAPGAAMQDLLLSAKELRGQQALLDLSSDIEGNPITEAITVRFLGLVRKEQGNGYLPVSERHQAEFARITRTIAVGQEFDADGQRWKVSEISEEGTTAQIIRAWVIKL